MGAGSRTQAILDALDRETRARYLLLALAPLFLLLLWPTSWNGNEETYFPLAYRRVAPAAFSEFHAVFDSSNARFLFEYLLGGLIKAVGYENAHSIARAAVAVVYAAAFGILFRGARLSILDALGVIALFCFVGQTLLGGEWIIRGVESKTFAYAPVIAAIGLGFEGRWRIAAALAIVATYFHFLVGGFWILALALLALIRTKGIAVPLRLLGVSVAAVAPLVAVLAIEQLGHSAPASTVSPAEIYALRVPHHIDPFAGKWTLWTWSPGIVATAALAAAFFVASRRSADAERGPARFVFWLLVYLLAALGLTYLDRHTHFFGRFYVFRPASLILLLAIVFFLGAVRRAGVAETGRLARQLALAVLLIWFTWGQVKDKVEDYVLPRHEIPGQAEMIAAVERESGPEEIILIEPTPGHPILEGEPPRASLHRKIPRPTLVSWKFTPTLPHELARWHALIEFRKEVFQSGCTQPQPLKYRIRLLLVYQPETLEKVKSCGAVVWKGRTAWLVRVADQWAKPSP